MRFQARVDPLEASGFFADGRSARSLVPGTVPRGFLREDDHLYTGRVNGALATTLPFPVTPGLLARGRERYDIFCAACHDGAGTGNGVVVRRGFPRPTSFHRAKLREAPVGHFFDTITNGFGRMQDYSYQVKPEDRWAIAAYIRALQLSQNARVSDVPPEERQRFEQ